MRGTLQQSAFQEAVSLVQGITQTKLSNPVVENLVLRFGTKESELLATNLSISIRIKLEVEVTDPGEIALPAKILGQVVRELPSGEVELTLKDREIQMEAGRSHFHLSGLSTEDFPPFLPEVKGPVLEIPVELATRALERTVFATSEERARYQLGGIKFLHKKGNVRMVATDGRRLSCVNFDLEDGTAEDCTMLIPARAAQEVLRALPSEGTVKITIGEKRVLFETEKLTVASTLLEDNFPPYEGLLQSSFPTQVVAEREDLLASVRRASVLASERSKLVHLSAKEGTLQVRGERQETGGAESEMDAETPEKKVEGSYNGQYLLECLRVASAGRVAWCLVQEGGAAYFKNENDDSFLHIIMPMTVKEESVPPEEEA
jgi:DNA polymerase-3 subunit beta